MIPGIPEDSWAVAGYIRAMADSSLPLTVQEVPGRVRLCLGGLAHGDGPTLQDAADDLVQRLLSYVMAFRASGFQAPVELGPPDLAAIDFLYELGETAAACSADHRADDQDRPSRFATCSAARLSASPLGQRAGREQPGIGASVGSALGPGLGLTRAV